MVPLFVYSEIPFTHGCFMPTLVEIGPAVLEKMFKFREYIFAISLENPMK